ncbi:2483_t:CDS:1 [Ambispora gerdemannii]|uniref:2483_t:CDS:1 n=1 Tax=Ambispora gerdemannii TaxID=144530 RepID=A0A9N9DL47_9GLOM|nr:2483_t:CDS:1 [Ambispora gerdemannii]
MLTRPLLSQINNIKENIFEQIIEVINNTSYERTLLWFTEDTRRKFTAAVTDSERRDLWRYLRKLDKKIPAPQLLSPRTTSPQTANDFLIIGCCLQNGIGAPRDQSLAIRYYEKAAHAGNSYAQFIIGHLHSWRSRDEFFCSFQKNDCEAFKWYKLSAESGNRGAQFMLAVHYGAGIGVKKDKSKAFYWINAALRNGHPRAMSVLGKYYGNGIGTERDMHQAIRVYIQSIRDGDFFSALNLEVAFRKNYN